MKTNHRRGFVAPAHRAKGGTPFHKASPLSDHAVSTMALWDVSNGHRGMAKAVRGAKKFVNSRFRFHEKAATKRQAAEGE